MPFTCIARTAAVLVLAGTAAAVPAAAHAADRGGVLDTRRVAHLSRAQVAAHIKPLGLPARRVRFGLDAYRLSYATVGVSGEPTTATGLVVLPRNHARRLRTVSYAHGTMAARADAPSRSLDSLAGASALLIGGTGYATVAPDYLGLGYGPGPHPYIDLATEGSASLDLLRAARTFAAARGRRLDRRVLVTGFSQGGNAAMALGRLLQEHADARLRLRALAPMSGPYDIEHAEIPAVLDGKLDPITSNYYLSYLLHAWQRRYHLYDSPADVWRGDWAARVPALFDGHHDDVAIMRVLPHRLRALFTPALLARLAHPDGSLLTALRANGVACRWAPSAPIRLYAARGDAQAAFSNSRHCITELRARGVHARLYDMGETGHFGSTLAALPRVLDWFDRLPAAQSR